MEICILLMEYVRAVFDKIGINSNHKDNYIKLLLTNIQ